jgi:hypothetical protein
MPSTSASLVDRCPRPPTRVHEPAPSASSSSTGTLRLRLEFIDWCPLPLPLSSTGDYASTTSSLIDALHLRLTRQPAPYASASSSMTDALHTSASMTGALHLHLVNRCRPVPARRSATSTSTSKSSTGTAHLRLGLDLKLVDWRRAPSPRSQTRQPTPRTSSPLELRTGEASCLCFTEEGRKLAKLRQPSVKYF